MEANDKMATSEQNKIAGRFLVDARRELRLSQAEMAAILTQDFGGVVIKQGALSGYETANRSVPAAVVVAVLRRLGTSLRVGESAEDRMETERLRRLELTVERIAISTANALDALAEAGAAPEATRKLAREVRASLEAAELERHEG